MFSYLLAICFLFVSPCSAACCKNSGAWWCAIGGIDCTPNCDDGHSYCDPAIEVCKNDNWGGCNAIVTETATSTVFPPLNTETDYTTTVQEYSSSVTITEYLTVASVVASTSTEVVTETSTATTTTTSPPRLRLHKRIDAPTVTATVTITDDNHCYSLNEPGCTTTIQGASTEYLETTLTTTVTEVNAVTTVVVETSTEVVTETETETVEGSASSTEPAVQTSASEEQGATSIAPGVPSTSGVSAQNVASITTSSGSGAASSTAGFAASTNGAQRGVEAWMVPVLFGQMLLF